MEREGFFRDISNTVSPGGLSLGSVQDLEFNMVSALEKVQEARV